MFISFWLCLFIKTLATKEEIKTLATKTELNAEQDKIVKLQTYDSSLYVYWSKLL